MIAKFSNCGAHLSPASVLHLLGLTPNKCNRQGYWILRCPVHKEGKEIHPSLNIHQQDGHYRCHACGIKGSNIIEFYCVATGKPFAVAIKELLLARP